VTTRRPTAPRAPAARVSRLPAQPAKPVAKPAGKAAAGKAAARPGARPVTTAAAKPVAKRPGAGTRAPGRPASRPGAARSGAGPGRAARPTRTGRARPPVIRPVTALAGVLVVLTLLIAPYVRPWVSQRSQISAAKQEVLSLQEEVAQLTAEQQRWNDPAFVEAQARDRLKYVKPGEIAYAVLGDAAGEGSADPRDAAVAVPRQDAARPWYATLWGSVEAAGDPTTRQRDQP